MRSIHSKLKAERSREGFAILIVLVAVVIMMLLYFIDIRAIFGPKHSMKSDKPTSRPWLEEDRLVGPDDFIKMPKPPKPIIDEDFTVTCFVTSEGSNRGAVRLEFNTLGEVEGSWSCRYLQNDRENSFEADFAGNIDITKTFSDKDGKDKSKLYFITKGTYTQSRYNTKTARVTEETGIVYTTGWLEANYTAFGLITITDKEHSWSASYDWQTE